MMSLDLFLLLIIISAKAETLLQFQLGHTHIYVSWNFTQSLPPPLLSKRFVFILILLVWGRRRGGAEKYVLRICTYKGYKYKQRDDFNARYLSHGICDERTAAIQAQLEPRNNRQRIDPIGGGVA